uniref:Uncharacterized protein n=1 Tax=Meloidogyne enterolobii TaxID=390850 RepID=A0A6V7XJE4_MELEN|nr:unnamed protein product [Meloidogyne enterolobii]
MIGIFIFVFFFSHFLFLLFFFFYFHLKFLHLFIRNCPIFRNRQESIYVFILFLGFFKLSLIICLIILTCHNYEKSWQNKKK